MLSSIWRLAATCTLAVALSACGGGGTDDGAGGGASAPATIVAEATARGFGVWVTAADKAGLLPALSAEGASLTLFVPTDAAFTTMARQIGFASAADMVAALDASAWARILQYHLLPTKKLVGDFATGGSAQATMYVFEGAARVLGFTFPNGGVSVSDDVASAAGITTADVAASNGVIHVIDKVLIPVGVLNIVQMVKLNPSLSTLAEAIDAANLVATLSGPGPFTLFAPHDQAFSLVLTDLNLTKSQLPASPELPGILSYHAVAGVLRSSDLATLPLSSSVTTLQGTAFTMVDPTLIRDGRNRLAVLIGNHVSASNGVIHRVNRVLLPAPAN